MQKATLDIYFLNSIDLANTASGYRMNHAVGFASFCIFGIASVILMALAGADGVWSRQAPTAILADALPIFVIVSDPRIRAHAAKKLSRMCCQCCATQQQVAPIL